MIFMMVNEAATCVEEGLVTDPADVDFIMMTGTGFAPSVGGPLRYAESIGLPQIVRQVEELATRESARFAPCGLLREMAASGRHFE